MSSEKFSKLEKNAVRLISLFASAYVSKQMFSRIKHIKSKNKFSTSEGHLEHFYCFVLFLFYLPYLSSIHEKANCIAILWTGSPHSLGSCLFRGLWATCLPHKGGASR